MAVRKTRTTRSTTTPKSSEKPTEKPQSDSQASEKASDETSTQKEESSSSSSSDDENDALFDEADAKASEDAPVVDASEDGDPDDESDDADEPEDITEGEIVTFDVVDPVVGEYSFQGVVNGNTIVVTEDATREFQLPGSKKTGKVLAHHKGQLLPLASFEHFITKGE